MEINYKHMLTNTVVLQNVVTQSEGFHTLKSMGSNTLSAHVADFRMNLTDGPYWLSPYQASGPKLSNKEPLPLAGEAGSTVFAAKWSGLVGIGAADVRGFSVYKPPGDDWVVNDKDLEANSTKTAGLSLGGNVSKYL